MGQEFFWLGINQFLRRRFPHIHHLTVDELYQWLQNSDQAVPLLWDARTFAEYKVSHLYQGQPIPDDIETYLKSYNHRPIVVYCSIGYRSALVVEKLHRKGYTEVFNLTGSLFQWVTKGYDIYQEQQVIRQIHPYSNGWQWLLTLMLPDYHFVKK
ncbi:MAG: rhodanese-like domain-containing protein [Microcystaceae cyanobacterium]